MTGASGMLGSALLQRAGGDCTVLGLSQSGGPGLVRADVRDFRVMKDHVEAFAPDLIIHAAALTNPEYCEQHQEEMHAVNVQSTEHLAALAAAHKIPLVFISSSAVFDGQRDWYEEADTPGPQSAYGRSKLSAELIVRALPKWFIFRAAWMFGGGAAKDKKFVGIILRQLLGGATAVHAVTDCRGTVTYTENLADTILRISQSDAYGIYHAASEDGLSRYDIACVLARLLRSSATIVPVTSDYFTDRYFVTRPKSEQLRCAHLKARGWFAFPPAETVLSHYVRSWQ